MNILINPSEKKEEMFNNKLEWTVVLVKDDASKGYTAYFAQLPTIIAEGETEDEATKYLFDTMQAVFKNQKVHELDATAKLKHAGVKIRSFPYSIVG